MSFRPKKKPEPLDEPALYEYAVRALGRRMRTVAELKRLMRPKVEVGESGDVKLFAVTERLKQHGYLNDISYAADYTRLRQENDKFGKRRVQQELTRKGVASDLVASAIEKGYENIGEEDLARQHLARKRISPPSNEKESARIVRQLLRAGFSTSAIFKVLKNWQVPDETLAALETIDTEQAGNNE
jgi:regulatory protein